jgi:1,4-dihydroxy-2-naphthoate octaprenyltransferase
VVMALGRYLTNMWLSALLLIWACASILLSFFNSNIPGMVAATLVVPLLILITQKEEKVKHPRQLNTSGQ